MSVLFGHPTGTPFSYHAALAHLEHDRLERLCIPWMPSRTTVQLLESIKPLRPLARRFSRRHFQPLARSRKVESHAHALWRQFLLSANLNQDKIVDFGNDWLMRTMTRECTRGPITAVHSYEDCSLLQFSKAKRLGKACLYDLPIGYFEAWEETQRELASRFEAWIPTGNKAPAIDRRTRKRQELSLADLVLVPSEFVADTVRRFHPDKKIAVAAYGVDLGNWVPTPKPEPRAPLNFLFAGQCSLRKGTPLLLEAWRAAAIKDAHLRLVGAWQMNDARKAMLPPNCSWTGPVSSAELRNFYQEADVFVFPTYFEGRALVVPEALASGLPVITTRASGASDLINDETGRLIPVGDGEALIEQLRWFANNRNELPRMSGAARLIAERCSWDNYRQSLAEAVASFI